MSASYDGARVVQVRVDEMRPGDVLVGSSRTVVTTPGPGSRRRYSQLVVASDGKPSLVQWKAATLVYVRRPIDVPPARRDLDG